MVAPVPPDKMTMRLAAPAPPASGFGATVSSGRPPFNITIEAADGATLLVLREVNGRLVAEGDESRWDEAAKRFLYGMLQWSGQFPVRWKDEARRAAEGQ
jgi:hypothetical protein